MKSARNGRAQALDVYCAAKPQDLTAVPGHALVLDLQDRKIFACQAPAAGSLL
jgi:hypothetical protein